MARTREEIIDNLQNWFLEDYAPLADIWSPVYAEWIEKKYAELVQGIELLKEKTQ